MFTNRPRSYTLHYNVCMNVCTMYVHACMQNGKYEGSIKPVNKEKREGREKKEKRSRREGKRGEERE